MHRLRMVPSLSSVVLLVASTALAREGRATLSEKQLAVIASRTAGMSAAEKAVVEGWSA